MKEGYETTSVLTRFAPSPTGFLHPGNIRVALQNYLFAQKHKGHFILRIDDTDTERCEQRFVDAIIKDLEWMGIIPDKTVYQSQHSDLYIKAQHTLKEKGLLYPCYETPEELEAERRLLRKLGKPPVYSRKSYSLSDSQKKALEAKGIKPHWRFLLPDTCIEWEDMCKGKRSISLHNTSDPVLVRADGSLTFLLASVVDDIHLNISHIIRGEDHISNTAVHIALEKALVDRGTLFSFGHTTLLHAKEGVLSKSSGSCSILSLQEKGILPSALLYYLVKLGSPFSFDPGASLTEITQSYAIDKYSKSSPLFDLQQLKIINKSILHSLSYDQLPDLYKKECTPKLWECIGANVDCLADITQWHTCLHSTPQQILLDEDDKVYIQQIITSLEKEGDIVAWKGFFQHIKEISQRSGKKLFMPIRKALTGLTYGPEISDCAEYLGKKEVLSRLLNVI